MTKDIVSYKQVVSNDMGNPQVVAQLLITQRTIFKLLVPKIREFGALKRIGGNFSSNLIVCLSR
jgi:hypothetical protein